jgi:pimeloyl-ACP methyl ester carboxylesterase
VKIKYEVIGEEGPCVALMTGGRRSYHEFLPLAAKISSHGYRVLLHDRRNTGASDILIEGSQGEEVIWADDLRQLLTLLGIESAFVGGASSGSRTSILFYLRHPTFVRGLLLMRLTGGEFAANRLPENYYGQFIRAAQQGGMAAVCQMQTYRERIEANPANEIYLMNLSVDRYIEVMSRWRDVFVEGARLPVMGFSADTLRAIDTSTLIVPGNDLVHCSATSQLAHRLIARSELHQLPLKDLQVPLVSFEEWAPYVSEIADAMATFMRRNNPIII